MLQLKWSEANAVIRGDLFFWLVLSIGDSSVLKPETPVAVLNQLLALLMISLAKSSSKMENKMSFQTPELLKLHMISFNFSDAPDH